MVLIGGYSRIGNNGITILINDVGMGSNIDLQEAKTNLEKPENRYKQI